jgi:hypothetical protein
MFTHGEHSTCYSPHVNLTLTPLDIEALKRIYPSSQGGIEALHTERRVRVNQLERAKALPDESLKNLR